jgi:hypothetical protein
MLDGFFYHSKIDILAQCSLLFITISSRLNVIIQIRYPKKF